MCRSLEFGKREKKFYRKTEFLGTWKIEQKIFGNFLTQEFYTYLKSAQNSASFDTLHTQFRRIFFQLLLGAVLFFWKLKAQIR
jgi:hypothetical protein